MTLKKIADAVGVSVSTVSRVINKNDEKSASKETRDKIWELVKTSGYTPNKNAQALQGKNDSTARQNLRLACIFARVSDVENDQFFNTLYRIAEKEAFRHNHFIKHTFTISQIDEILEKDLIKQLEIDGILVLGRLNKEILKQLSKHCKNMVYIGLNNLDIAVDQIICDGYKAAADAVGYLHTLGHHSIGYVGEKSNEVRFQGYENTLKQLNLPVVPSHIIDAGQSIDGGYRGCKKLLTCKDLPTAVFCANDITAVGVIRAIKEKGLRVPADISVISIDNIEMAGYVDPMLTTVEVPLEEMGSMAAKILIDRILGGHKLPIKIEIPFKIIRRESCILKS